MIFTTIDPNKKNIKLIPRRTGSVAGGLMAKSGTWAFVPPKPKDERPRSNRFQATTVPSPKKMMSGKWWTKLYWFEQNTRSRVYRSKHSPYKKEKPPVPCGGMSIALFGNLERWGICSKNFTSSEPHHGICIYVYYMYIYICIYIYVYYMYIYMYIIYVY